MDNRTSESIRTLARYLNLPNREMVRLFEDGS
jgi:hypothetical protein